MAPRHVRIAYFGSFSRLLVGRRASLEETTNLNNSVRGSIFCGLILVVYGAGEVIGLLFGEVAGGEEEVVVDLDRGELRKFLMKEVDGGDGGGADFDFVGGVFGEELPSVDEGG